MFRKISVKLFLALGFTFVLIIGVYAYYSISSQYDMQITSLEKHVNQLSETVKNSTRYDMLHNERERILNIISTIGKAKSFQNVRIINKEGEINYSSNPDDIGHLVDKAAESCYACHAANQPLTRLNIKERTRIFSPHPDSSRVLGIITPIYNEKSCWEAECHAHEQSKVILGVLDITVCLKEYDENLKKSEIGILLVAIISIFSIGTIVWLFLRKWVDGPVKELVKATNNIAAGNLNYHIEKTGKDELGFLAKSFNNMTDKLAQARLQLFQSDKMASLGKLAAGVAHEINNPLTGVLTYSSFLLKRMNEHPEWKEDLEVIVRETKRSREIVKGLLDFARQSTPKKQEVNINEVIERAITVIANQLTLSNIQIVRNFEKELPLITADSNQIQQVVLNLVVNAMDAIEQHKGQITLSTELLKLKPFGITQIKKAVCPKGHNLIDQDHRIGGLPAIRVKINSNGNEGYLHLNAIYGKNNHHLGIEFQQKKISKMSCPECNISLVNESKKCPECDAPVYEIQIPDKGMLEGCTRFGCGWQIWQQVDLVGEKQYVQIRVADNGCGIPQENLDKIFDPFFSTKGQKGTGLGLSVIWGIIDNHNGKISVESVMNKGTAFTIQLPVKG
ncbi:MAG: ATP-binding protein [bacterium]